VLIDSLSCNVTFVKYLLVGFSSSEKGVSADQLVVELTMSGSDRPGTVRKGLSGNGGLWGKASVVVNIGVMRSYCAARYVVTARY
jgi:hypothetical protein